MDFAPKQEQPMIEEESTNEVIEISESTRKLAMLALICALDDDCASGPSYPNIPFGD